MDGAGEKQVRRDVWSVLVFHQVTNSVLLILSLAQKGSFCLGVKSPDINIGLFYSALFSV